MANALEQQILDILKQARDEIRVNMDARGVNASGRTSASVRVEKYDKGFRLIGGTNGTHPVTDYPRWKGTADAADTAPIPTLEFGRGVSTKTPPVPRAFYYIIRQWTRDKGLNFSSETERSTFAYFLSRKIAREGTERARNHIDIYSTPVMNAKDRINVAVKTNVFKTLREAILQVKAASLQGAFTS